MRFCKARVAIQHEQGQAPRPESPSLPTSGQAEVSSGQAEAWLVDSKPLQSLPTRPGLRPSLSTRDLPLCVLLSLPFVLGVLGQSPQVR